MRKGFLIIYEEMHKYLTKFEKAVSYICISVLHTPYPVVPQHPPGGGGEEPVFVNLLWSPGIDSKPGVPVRQPYLSYRPARLHRLAESIHRNRFLGSLNVYKYEHWVGEDLHSTLAVSLQHFRFISKADNFTISLFLCFY